ncbi:hypothetical protein Dip510_000232 [Elusimicrobium posterum]|uniref:LPP20 family lipoprotein n=1 Tax=Elusimicrobium posterum TaxID=3116653 RepID=UPI003C76A574
MRKILSLLFIALFLAACGGMNSSVKKGEIAPKFSDTVVDKNYLWVRGFGAVNPSHQTDTQKRIMSREAAIAHGYQRAAEYIYGSGVYAQMNIKDAVAQDSTINNKVQGLVAGMEVFETEYLNDGGCTVIMRLKLDKLEKANITLK